MPKRMLGRVERTVADRLNRHPEESADGKVWLGCKRCQHYWPVRKDPSEVRICPRCKSAYWNVERNERKVKTL